MFSCLVMFLYCSAEEVYLGFTDTEKSLTDILKFTSSFEGRFSDFYDTIKNVDEKTLEIIRDYKIKKITKKEAEERFLKVNGPCDQQERKDGHVATKKNKDGSGEESEDVFMITLFVPKSLYLKVVSISIFNELPSFTTTEIHHIVNYLYFFLDNKQQMQYAVLFFIGNNAMSYEELQEIDNKEESPSAGLSSLHMLLLEARDNFMYIYRDGHGCTAQSLPSVDHGEFDNRIPLVIDRDHPCLGACVEGIFLDIDFLLKNRKDITAIFYEEESISRLTLELDINELRSKYFKKHKDKFAKIMMESICNTFFGRGKYRKVILNLENLCHAVDYTMIPADSYVIRLTSIYMDIHLDKLPKNVTELCVSQSWIGSLAIGGDIGTISLSDVKIESRIYFLERNNVKHVILDEVEGFLDLQNASQLESVELLGRNEYLRLGGINKCRNIKCLKLSWNLDENVLDQIKLAEFENLEVFSIANSVEHRIKSEVTMPNCLMRQPSGLFPDFEQVYGGILVEYDNYVLRKKWYTILSAMPCQVTIKDLNISYVHFHNQSYYEILAQFSNLEALTVQFTKINKQFFAKLPLSLKYLDISFTSYTIYGLRMKYLLQLDTLIMYLPPNSDTEEKKYCFYVFQYIDRSRLTYLDIGNVDFNYLASYNIFNNLKTLIIRDSVLCTFFSISLCHTLKFYGVINTLSLDKVIFCQLPS